MTEQYKAQKEDQAQSSTSTNKAKEGEKKLPRGEKQAREGEGKARETDVFGGFHPKRVGSITLSQATKVSGKGRGGKRTGTTQFQAQRLREKKGGE